MSSDNIVSNYTFIDSYTDWQNILKKSKYKLNPDLFDIEHTFVDTDKVSKRKRKKPTKEFLALQSSHNKLNLTVKHFKETFRKKQVPLDVTAISSNVFNGKAKDIARKYIENDELIIRCNVLKERNQLNAPVEEDTYFNRLISNPDSNWKEISVLSGTYLLPPMSSFIMSDIKFANKLLGINQKFDLIVIDPPVTNKSVKCKSVYDFLDEIDILELPLRQLMNDNCIVAIWCTNSEKCLDSVQSCMLPAWGLEMRATCTWLKVTNHGDSVLHINDPFRRPYEKLFLARYHPQPTTDASDDPLFDLHEHVLLSVPCSLHSAKPNLENFLDRLLPTTDRRCLELFARNLYPGWLSWGNEPLKFLRTDLLVQADPEGASLPPVDDLQSIHTRS